jgi:hypothetical protein
MFTVTCRYWGVHNIPEHIYNYEILENIMDHGSRSSIRCTDDDKEPTNTEFTKDNHVSFFFLHLHVHSFFLFFSLYNF